VGSVKTGAKSNARNGPLVCKCGHDFSTCLAYNRATGKHVASRDKVPRHNANGINVKSVRPRQRPTVSRTDGGQSPLVSGLTPPASRLVGVELNPGPGGRKPGNQKKSVNNRNPARPAVSGNRRQGRKGAMQLGDAPTVLQHTAPMLSDIIEKDEYVADLLGSGGTSSLNITSYAINPGQSSLFPLGAAEAAKWTTWKCVSCEPYLMHEVSEFATDGSTGKVILAVDYNAANTLATTKQQLEDMHSASCMPSEDVGLKLIPRLLNRADPKYVRIGTQPSNTDIRLYDGGVLYVAAIGQAGTSKVAELRIRYKFKMELPTLLNPSGGSPTVLPGAVLTVTSNPLGEAAAATTVFQTQFASATTPVVTNNIGATIASSGLITLLPGKYLIALSSRSWDSAAAISNSNIQLCQVATASTQIVFTTSFTATAMANQVSTHNAFVNPQVGVIWDTAQDGLTVSLQVSATYASGSALNFSLLSITYLAAAVVGSELAFPSVEFLQQKLARYEQMLMASTKRVDSDFDEEDHDPLSPSVACSSSMKSLTKPDVIGELMARKLRK